MSRPDIGKLIIHECMERIRRNPSMGNASYVLLEDLLRRSNHPTMRFCVTYRPNGSANVCAQKADARSKTLAEELRKMARQSFFASYRAVQQSGKSVRSGKSDSDDRVSCAATKHFQR